MTVIPATAVIPTRNRLGPLRRTLESLARQSAQPTELVVVDASDGPETERLCGDPIVGLGLRIWWFPAKQRGAAAQRNEGVGYATEPVIAFFDDDILFEPECVAKLWDALNSDPKLGGVNATITNQGYTPPGRVTRAVLRLMGGPLAPSYAGRVVGPGVNLLPEDRDDLLDVVPTEWLNTTCTLYRRAALPDPPFPDHFTGYSLCEDLTLSVNVGRRGWKLANARTARIFHDSQPGDHKRSHVALSAMELKNRHYVMTRVLGRRNVADYLRLAVWEGFQVAAAAGSGPARAAAEVWGKLRGVTQLMVGGGV